MLAKIAKVLEKSLPKKITPNEIISVAMLKNGKRNEKSCLIELVRIKELIFRTSLMRKLYVTYGGRMIMIVAIKMNL